jgi:hypothetical protein
MVRNGFGRLVQQLMELCKFKIDRDFTRICWDKCTFEAFNSLPISEMRMIYIDETNIDVDEVTIPSYLLITDSLGLP